MSTQSEIGRNYRRLKVLLEATDSFVLTFALYRDIKEQRENAEKLKDLLDLPVTEVALKGNNLNPVRTFLSLPKEPRQTLFFTFLGSSLPEGKSDFDKFAGYVNIQREAFTDAPHAVVLWLREEQLIRLMRRAPDFWAWRSGVFDMRGALQPDLPAHREFEEVDTFERGALEEQVALYREILKGQLERDAPDLAYVARTRLRLANILYKLGLYKAVVTEAQEVIRLSAVLEDKAVYLQGLNSLASVLSELGHFNEAEALYHEVLEGTEEISGKATSDYVFVLSNLANLLSKVDRYDEAKSKLYQALEITKEISGTENLSYASGLNSLAEVLRGKRNHGKAELLFRKAVEITERIQGKENPSYIASLSNLASLLVRVGRYDEAEPLYREALELDEKTVGKKHPNYANKLNNLTKLLWDTGRYEEAEFLCSKALEICEERLGTNHPDTQLVFRNHARLLQKLEQQTNP